MSVSAQGQAKLALTLLILSPALIACGPTQVVARQDSEQTILIRSPQPSESDIKDLHKRYGLRTVINLRGHKPGKSWFEEEKRGVEAIGARWIHLAVNSRRAPAPELVREFFEVIGEEQNWPVLIHCQGGIHRTGLMTALYRIQFEGWSNERAVAEMEKNYFNWGTTDRSRVLDFVRSYKPQRKPSKGPRRIHKLEPTQK